MVMFDGVVNENSRFVPDEKQGVELRLTRTPMHAAEPPDGHNEIDLQPFSGKRAKVQASHYDDEWMWQVSAIWVQVHG